MIKMPPPPLVGTSRRLVRFCHLGNVYCLFYPIGSIGSKRLTGPIESRACLLVESQVAMHTYFDEADTSGGPIS